MGTLQVIEELEKVLAFNNLLTSLSKHSDSGQFAQGVGPVSLIGMSSFKELLPVPSSACYESSTS